MGTAQGSVIAVSFEEKEKKEKGGKVVLDMSASAESVKGIAQLPMPQNQLLLLISTAKHLYAFTGSTSLEKLGDSYQGSPSGSILPDTSTKAVEHGNLPDRKVCQGI